MSENYLKHYEMELIILSPVYIGSGEKIGKKEYIFLPVAKLAFSLQVRHLLFQNIHSHSSLQ